jgi:hypothetical protein
MVLLLQGDGSGYLSTSVINCNQNRNASHKEIIMIINKGFPAAGKQSQ